MSDPPQSDPHSHSHFKKTMFIRHRHPPWISGKLPRMTSQTLASTLEGFLSGSSNAVVIEDGAVVFNLDQGKYSVSGESNKCLLHLWSPERNVVRRVLDVETKGETLRVTVQRMGQVRPTRLDICRERDPRTTSAKRAARLGYQRTLERALKRKFPDLTVAQLSTSMDLEKSFGPIYARGLLKRGQSGFAVLGVNRQELQSSIDGALTFGILWLDVCRQAQAGKLVVEGLKLFVPSRCSELLRERIAHLNRAVAKWEVYEFEDRGEEMLRLEVSDRGNIETRLTHYCDDSETRARFAEAVALVRTLMPEVEIGTLSSAEISFRCHGLEFACARLSVKPGDFRRAHKKGRSTVMERPVGEVLRGGGKLFYIEGGAPVPPVGAAGGGAAPVVLVMSRMSTRRLAARPSRVLFGSAGLSLPNPMR
jgi:hypothetical protein